MKTITTKIEDQVHDLLVCLEKDVEHLRESLSNLDELRSLVIKRDDAALGRLLERIESGSDDYRRQESKRQSLRLTLANSLDCPVGTLTLSTLGPSTTEPTQARILETKARLRELIGQFKKEYTITARLLSECSRFNKILLRGLFDIGRTGVVTYDARGTTKQHSQTAFVNMQF